MLPDPAALKYKRRMIMDIIELTADNAGLYSELIGRNAAENLGLKGFSGIAAETKGHPMAAMIWHTVNSQDRGDHSSSEIVRMEVKDAAAAKELIDAYSRRMIEAGTEWSSFVFDKVQCSTSIEVLRDSGFTLTEGEGTDLYTSVGVLVNRLLVRIKGSDDSIYGLGTLKKRTFNEVIRDCLSKTKRKLPEYLSNVGTEWFDPEVSCYSETECNINGMLLVHKLPEVALRVELLSSWGSGGETELALMIKYAVSTAFELYPPETPVIIRRHDELSRRLSSYCLPNVKGRPSIYGKRREMQ